MPTKHYDWKIGSKLPVIGSHSLAKHRIIQRYIRRYIEIVTSKYGKRTLKISFIDGYAGGGRYRHGRELVPGSPLILLQTVAEMEAKLKASRSNGFDIEAEFIFIDDKRDHTDFLRAEIEASEFKDRLDKSITIITADFNEQIDDVLKIVRNNSPIAGRSLFLLDQYGWSQVAFPSIRKIINTLAHAEVFLTFSVDALINYLGEHSHDLKAFAEIDIDPGFVRELVQIKQAEQVGYRSLIQHALYGHVQSATGAPFYSPFFIKSPDAHRSYWFIHLSKHREARNEIGMTHWAENNTTIHHGGAGLNALCFAPGKNADQFTMDYLFDEYARERSRATLLEQLPRLIHTAADADVSPSIETLFSQKCNDTPVVRELMEEALINLRSEGEITIINPTGAARPRALTLNWGDRVVIPPQRSFFGPFADLRLPKTT